MSSDSDISDYADNPPTTKKKNVSQIKGKSIEEIYQKKTQLEHILLRPDTYIGSVEAVSAQMWVVSDKKMEFKTIKYVPGFYKIFDEILVNAADNKIRDPSMDTLRVVIDKENGKISIMNNGKGIPIEMHSKEKVYVPELIFGHLLTSSNYDDDEKKVTGGRNGYGAKLCNTFSKEFIVETACRDSGKKFKQVFSENMSKKTTPSITNNSRKEEYTKITFKPDFEKFGMTNIDSDTESLLVKRVYDMAGCCQGVKVYLNDERISVRNFSQYVSMYLNASNENEEAGAQAKPIIHEICNDRWEVCVSLSDGQFQQVSFVNSISTTKGGTHVNFLADQISSKLIDYVNKKNKAAPVKPFQVKNHLWIFVKCLIENPTFDSQTKENLTLRSSAFGSKPTLTEEFLKKVIKSGVVENILSFAKFKQNQMLKKSDGTKKSRIAGITKLDDANNAGTRYATKCTLILTEGDSAKALAVSGLSVIGRDNYGVFPLRGKLLNVREASHSQIMANAEINNIKQIMGLQHGKTYTSPDSLRYGHIMVMTDQDHDGSHIKGLIINFIDHFWPSLLKIPGFLLEFITPIVKATKGKQVISFYTMPEYEEWKEATNSSGWNIKYYKGLGTSTAKDAKDYFSNMDLHCKSFSQMDDDDKELINLAFNKKRTDDRKEWLRQLKDGTYMDHSERIIHIKDFINKELILFSMADNMRSIPSVVDGMKPGQRKIIFSCFKRNLKGEIKVAQLAGYVSEHSAYHHGEQSLCSTIVNLAQDFTGSNNLNMLLPIGQFGTRLQGGKDAASPRYIFTSLNKLTRMLYHPHDDHILNYLEEDGQRIQPEWYMPAIPMILVNGGEGIGTGWSSFIPNYNPRDIVANIQKLMKGEAPDDMFPWYRGFKGTIEPVGPGKYNVTGTIRKIDDTTVEITELPVRTWTQSYKDMLESWLIGSDKTPIFIKDYKEYHTDTTVKFIVSLTEENMAIAEKEGLEKRFRLQATINTTNMVCFDSQNRIRKYNNVTEILEEFYELRLQSYQKRKEWLADSLTQEWTKLDNRVRFVLEIIEGKLIIQNKKKKDLLTELRKRGYAPISKQKQENEEEGEEDSERNSSNEDGKAYDYLLSMPLWSLTREKVEQLIKERDAKQEELDILLKKSPKDLWNEDLDAFLAEWTIVEEEYETAEQEIMAAASGISQKKGKKVNKPRAKKQNVDEDYTIISKKKVPVKEETKLSKEIVTKSEVIPSEEKISPIPSTRNPSSERKKKNEPIKIIDEISSDDEFDLPMDARINRLLQLQKNKNSRARSPSSKEEEDSPSKKKPKNSPSAEEPKIKAPTKVATQRGKGRGKKIAEQTLISNEEAEPTIPIQKKTKASEKSGANKETSGLEPKEKAKVSTVPKKKATLTKKGSARGRKAVISDEESDSFNANEDEIESSPEKVKRPARVRRAATTAKPKYIDLSSEEETKVNDILDDDGEFQESD